MSRRRNGRPVHPARSASLPALPRRGAGPAREDNWRRLNAQPIVTPPHEVARSFPAEDVPSYDDRSLFSPQARGELPTRRDTIRYRQPPTPPARPAPPAAPVPPVPLSRRSRQQVKSPKRQSKRSPNGRHPDPDSASGRILILGLGSIGVILLLIAYPTSRDQIGIVPPLPAGGPVSAARGKPNAPLTITGNPVLTRWGTVQVQIVVQRDRIVKARGVRYPNLNWHGQALNGMAVPELDNQVIARQHANLDAVSGATITSAGYEQSLQSAIDRVHAYEVPGTVERTDSVPSAEPTEGGSPAQDSGVTETSGPIESSG